MDPQKYHLALKTAFASEYSFYLKAQNFHWNVEGRNFKQDHELFGDIYEEVGSIIDAFAENLRKAGTYTPASLSRFSMLTVIDDETDKISAEHMITELHADSEKMANMFKVVFQLAEQNGDHGLSNFFADRQDAHKKHSWMLRASLKGNEAI